MNIYFIVVGRIQLSGSEIQIKPLALHSAAFFFFFFLADALSTGASAFLGVTAASSATAPSLFLFFFCLGNKFVGK